MARNDDERAFFNGQRNFCRNRRTVSCRVGTIEHFHARQVHLTCFQNDGEEFFHFQIFAQGTKTFEEECINGIVMLAKHECMISISCHAAHTEENKRFQGTNIFICVPNFFHFEVGSGAVCIAGRTEKLAKLV